MSKKKITVGLSEQDIDRAIREMAQYKTEFTRKVELLREKVLHRKRGVRMRASRLLRVIME